MRHFTPSLEYDPALDIWASKEGRKRLAILKNATPEMKALWRERARQTGQKKRQAKAKTKESVQISREEAEENCVDTIKAAVLAIQHALLVLQDVPAPRQYARKLLPNSVHNALFALKNKCGIHFPPDDGAFSRSITLDRPDPGGADGRQKYIPLWER